MSAYVSAMAAAGAAVAVDVPAVLARACADHATPPPRALEAAIAEVEADLAAIEAALAAMDVPGDAPAERSVRHLVARPGKRLRPMCVALAARAVGSFDDVAREIAVAAELVHAATLLHDDVVDLGDLRRGAPAARLLYGNAASVLGGDWLLVEAMRRIQAARVPGVLEHALVVLRSMLEAESIQLLYRGRVDAGRARYFEVVRGKTAQLFRWALRSGARAAGGDAASADALERFGDRLGTAFQIVDDVLDVAGDEETTGKSVLADVREGKMTLPLVIAFERDPRVGELVAAAIGDAEATADARRLGDVARAVRATGAVDAATEMARALSDEAVVAVRALPPTGARDALERAARALVDRVK